MLSRFFVIIFLGLFSCKGHNYKPSDGDAVFVLSNDIFVENRLGYVNIDLPIVQSYSCHNATDIDLDNSTRNYEYNGKFTEKFWKNLSFLSLKNNHNFSNGGILCDDRYFIIDSSGNLIAFAISNNNMNKLWTVNVNDIKDEKKAFRVGNAKISNDRTKIFISTNIGDIISYNAHNGAKLWKIKLNNGFYSSVSFDKNGDLFISSIDNIVFCIDANNGNIKWQQDLGHGKLVSLEIPPIIILDNIAIVATNNGKIFALNRENGGIIWDFRLFNNNISGHIVEISDIDYAPVLVGNILIVGGINSAIFGLNIYNGQPIWMLDTALYSNILHNNKDFAFFVDDQSRLIALHTISGKVKWINDSMSSFYIEKIPGYLNNGRSILSTRITRYYPLFMNNDIVIVDALGILRIFDTQTGKQNREYKVNKLIDSGIKPYKNSLFMQDELHNLYIF